MKNFYSKILLFGEYSVLAGSKALTIPFTIYEGHFEISNDKSELAIQSNLILKEFSEYIQEHKAEFVYKVDIDFFRYELEQGLYFNSTIPFGYGLGSSGALVAAFFDRYVKVDEGDQNNTFLSELKRDMAIAESFFHGTSSGIDPLSIYLGVTLKFDTENIILPDSSLLTEQLSDFYLVDAGKKSDTSLLVNIFLKKAKDKAYKKLIFNEFVPSVNSIIEKLTSFGKDTIKEDMKSISEFQLNYFRECIPDQFIQIWSEGLKSDNFYLKLCGSGGGGYLLMWSVRSYYDLQVLFDNPIIKIE